MTFTIRIPKRAVRAILAALLLALGALGLAACDSTPSPQQQENAQQVSVSEQLVKNQPVRGHPYSQMRENLQQIEDAQATGVQTTSFIFGKFSADPVQQCTSTGMPIPVTASLSNPQQVVPGWYGTSGSGSEVVSQMDPQGIYNPPTSSGTYVLCDGPDGQAEAVYAEGDVLTETGPATWDYGSHQVKLTGAPTAHFSTKQGG